MNVKTQPSRNVRDVATIDLLDQKATWAEIHKLARSMNRRLPTLSEFIIALKETPSLYDQAKGNGISLLQLNRMT